MTAGDAPSEPEDGPPGTSLPVRFQVWGARGSRNAVGSRIGNATSCYSLAVGADLFVFDAGSGLLALSTAMQTDDRLAAVERVHLLVSHAHWDHWEGLKDAEWMWRKNNGIALSILGPIEALDAIRRACEPPSFVPLDILALGTLASLSFVELAAGTSLQLPGAQLEALSLNHYSGIAPHRRYLDTLGYRLCVSGGPTLAYLCDHEPTDDTTEVERAALAAANLAIIDASYSSIAEHAFGHGSIESAARIARNHPDIVVLAAHHGPLRSDDEIEAAVQRYAAGLEHFALAIEGACHDWDPRERRFTLHTPQPQALASG